jgi:hypothetical protein
MGSNYEIKLEGRLRAKYDDTAYGRHFLSGRFLKMTETKAEKDTVFDKQMSEFIHYTRAAIEFMITGGKIA